MPLINNIEYWTFASIGNAIDFGDLTVDGYIGDGAVSDGTKGVFGGGVITGAKSNIIQYINIASLGNASDFGDMTLARTGKPGASNGTRGVWAGGVTTTSNINILDYVTIASLGNASDFGDLTVGRGWAGGCGDGTKGVFSGGSSDYQNDVNVNTIDYVNIASVGNATDFGDLTRTNHYTLACSDGIKGVAGGGYTGSNIIDYWVMASLGNASDFGDLTVGRRGHAPASGN